MVAVVAFCIAVEQDLMYVLSEQRFYDYVIGDVSASFSDSGKFLLNKRTWAEMSLVHLQKPVATTTTATTILGMLMSKEKLQKVKAFVETRSCVSSWRHPVAKL